MIPRHRFQAAAACASLFLSVLSTGCGGHGGPPAGSVPNGMPNKLVVGLFENQGQTWMKNSGVKWGARYLYLTNNWVTNWGGGPADGSFAMTYLRETDGQGFMPAIEYYVLEQTAGSESNEYQTLQNASTMASYFAGFKALMTQIKTYGKPVMVLMEADAYGFIEQQSHDNPGAPAAVASTGMAELQGLPNTVAGWGMAFLAIRKSVGATNALLGIHVSAWATGEDIAYGSVTDSVQPQVTKVYQFLSSLGLADNQTGQTYDFLVGDPLDRDSDYYALTRNDNRWWDPSDSAPVTTKSFNRYLSWLQAWNQLARKRWVLWQIPIGNSNQLNVANTGKPREGYKDNRAEYFFGSGGDDHIQTWANAGVIAMLFGQGAGDQSSYENDIYVDGKPFMQNHAGAWLQGGGMDMP